MLTSHISEDVTKDRKKKFQMFKKKEIQHLHHHILCHLCLLWTLFRLDKKSINEQRKCKNITLFELSIRQIDSFCYHKIIYWIDHSDVDKISHQFETIMYSKIFVYKWHMLFTHDNSMMSRNAKEMLSLYDLLAEYNNKLNICKPVDRN